jgi:hypothetical protein
MAALAGGIPGLSGSMGQGPSLPKVLTNKTQAAAYRSQARQHQFVKALNFSIG